MRSVLMFCAAMLGVVTPLTAQKPVGETPKKIRVSLLAIGDLPPIKYKDTDKGPVFIEPPKEDVPPPLLFVKSKDKSEGFDQLNLGLNTPMQAIEYPGGKPLVIYEDKESAKASESSGSDGKKPFLVLAMPEGATDITVILARNLQSKSWRTPPRVYAFKNDIASFPADSVRVINLSSHPVKGRLGGNRNFDLKPTSNELSSLILPANAEKRVLPYQIAGGVDGKAVILANTATSFYPGSRLNIVIYDGDGKDYAGVLRISVFAEPALAAGAAPAPTPVPAATTPPVSQ